MYKDLGTIMITGGVASGKTTMIKKYIDEVIKEGKSLIYIIDLKMVELFEYKNLNNVIYINKIEEIKEKMLDKIGNKKSDLKTYIFIDEYAEVRCNELIHKNIKQLIYKRDYLNLEVIITSQDKHAFCHGMRMKSDAVLMLNRCLEK